VQKKIYLYTINFNLDLKIEFEFEVAFEVEIPEVYDYEDHYLPITDVFYSSSVCSNI